jgi:hypothetical protein
MAQSNAAIASPETAFRSAATAQLQAEAAKLRVPLATFPIAYAGGDGGYVLNAGVAGVERLNPDAFAQGADVLFMYMGGRGFAVPEGFYRVNIRGKEARFIASNGKTVATLPATVEGAGLPMARAKVKVKLTASWGKNGPEIDIEITFGEAAAARSIVVEIPERPIAKAATD